VPCRRPSLHIHIYPTRHYRLKCISSIHSIAQVWLLLFNPTLSLSARVRNELISIGLTESERETYAILDRDKVMTIVDTRDITKNASELSKSETQISFFGGLEKKGRQSLPSLELDFFHYGGRAVREGVCESEGKGRAYTTRAAKNTATTDYS